MGSYADKLNKASNLVDTEIQQEAARVGARNREDRNFLTRTAIGGVNQAIASGYGMKGAFHSLMDDKVSRDEAEREARSYQRIAAENPPDVEGFLPNEQDTAALDSPLNLGQFAIEQLGRSIPSMGVRAAGAAAGAGLGTLVGGPAGTIAGLSAGTVGGFAGGLLSSGALHTGDMWLDLKEQGIDAPGSSLAFGMASGGIENIIGGAPVVNKLLGIPGLRNALTKASAKGGIRSAAKVLWDVGTGVVKTSGEEGFEEGFQEVLGMMNRDLNDPNFKWDREKFIQVVEAAGGGAVIGGMLGGAGSIKQSVAQRLNRPIPVDSTTGEDIKDVESPERIAANDRLIKRSQEEFTRFAENNSEVIDNPEFQTENIDLLNRLSIASGMSDRHEFNNISSELKTRVLEFQTRPAERYVPPVSQEAQPDLASPQLTQDEMLGAQEQAPAQVEQEVAPIADEAPQTPVAPQEMSDLERGIRDEQQQLIEQKAIEAQTRKDEAQEVEKVGELEEQKALPIPNAETQILTKTGKPFKAPAAAKRAAKIAGIDATNVVQVEGGYAVERGPAVEEIGKILYPESKIQTEKVTKPVKTEAKTEVAAEEKVTTANIPKSLKEASQKDIYDRGKQPGIDYRALPNVVSLQLRDLDSNPIRDGLLAESYDGSEESAAKAVVKLFEDANERGVDYSRRETAVVATDANGVAKYFINADQTNDKIRVMPIERMPWARKKWGLDDKKKSEIIKQKPKTILTKDEYQTIREWEDISDFYANKQKNTADIVKQHIEENFGPTKIVFDKHETDNVYIKSVEFVPKKVAFKPNGYWDVKIVTPQGIESIQLGIRDAGPNAEFAAAMGLNRMMLDKAIDRDEDFDAWGAIESFASIGIKQKIDFKLRGHGISDILNPKQQARQVQPTKGEQIKAKVKAKREAEKAKETEIKKPRKKDTYVDRRAKVSKESPYREGWDYLKRGIKPEGKELPAFFKKRGNAAFKGDENSLSLDQYVAEMAEWDDATGQLIKRMMKDTNDQLEIIDAVLSSHRDHLSQGMKEEFAKEGELFPQTNPFDQAINIAKQIQETFKKHEKPSTKGQLAENHALNESETVRTLILDEKITPEAATERLNKALADAQKFAEEKAIPQQRQEETLFDVTPFDELDLGDTAVDDSFDFGANVEEEVKPKLTKGEQIKAKVKAKKEAAKKPPADKVGINPDQAIRIAADSIEELRGQDVFRVLETYPDNAEEIAEYIKKNRPDLAETVNEDMAELKDDKERAEARHDVYINPKGGESRKINTEPLSLDDAKKLRNSKPLRIRGLISIQKVETKPAAKAEAESKKSSEKVKEVTKAEKKSEEIDSVESYNAVIKRIDSGDITADELRAAFKSFTENRQAFVDFLKTKNKKQIAAASGYFRDDMKKDRLIEVAVDRFAQDFIPQAPSVSGMTSFQMAMFESTTDAVNRQIKDLTDEDIARISEKTKEVKREREAQKQKRKDAVKDPKTLTDFRIALDEGVELTEEQQAMYDDLATEARRERTKKRKEARQAKLTEAVGDLGMSMVEAYHDKKDIPMFVVQQEKRVERDEFNTLKSLAKANDGYWSRYRGGRAKPGFQFTSQENAQAFIDAATDGDKATATETIKEKTGSEKLKDTAERIMERAVDKRDQDRRTNTARQAGMAASSIADAESDIAIAKTMQNIAKSIDDGTAVHLTGLRDKTQVETIKSIMRRAKLDYALANDISTVSNEYKALPTWDSKYMEFVKYPEYQMHADSINRFANELDNVGGAKLMANRLRKIHKSLSASDKQMYTFDSVRDLEIIDKMKKKLKGESIMWLIDNDSANIGRLNRMDVLNLQELRAALREFASLKEDAKGEDPIAKLERDIKTDKFDGLDFFPTPKPLANRMVEMADIEPGMKVLEPSAGKGDIAQSIQDAHPDAEVTAVEVSGKLREIIKAKGLNLSEDRDFLEHEGEYDRIVMNPPFSKNKDVEHVRHAYSLLKPGGKIIAIVSEHPFFANDKVSKEFREWFEEVGVFDEKMEGAFQGPDAFRKTGVNTRLIEIEKPAGDVKFSVKEFNSVDDIKSKWESQVDDIFISEDDRYIRLNNLVVAKGDRKQGVGTAIMEDIVSYADQSGKVARLTPALKDDRKGTTSKARLKKFYKRFGFVENKGRNKDFIYNADEMYRDPKGDIKFSIDGAATRAPITSENVGDEFPGATVTNDGKNYTVELPSGAKFNITMTKEIPTDVATIMRDYGVTREKAQIMAKQGAKGATVSAGATVELSDGQELSLEDINIIIQESRGGIGTVRHEGLHVAKQLGFFDSAYGKSLWDSLMLEYGSEENIANAREVWTGQNGLWGKLVQWFNRLKLRLGFEINPDAALNETFTEQFWSQGVDRSQGPDIRFAIDPVTSIKNDAVDELRALRKSGEITAVEAESQQQWLDDAAVTLKNDYTAGARLVTELEKESRVLNDRETAIMQVHYRREYNVFKQLSDALFEAQESGDPAATATAQTAVNNQLVALNGIEEVTRSAGREWGRAGVARQIALRKDFSLEGMERKARVANGGKALNKEQMAEIKELSETVERLEKRILEESNKVSDLERQAVIRDLLNEEIAKSRKLPKVKKSKESVDDLAEGRGILTKFGISLKKKIGKALKFKVDEDVDSKAGAEPQIIQELYSTALKIAKSLNKDGITSIGAFIAAIRDEYGETSPEVEYTFAKAWNEHVEKSEDSTALTPGDIDVSNPKSVTKEARLIQRELVIQGITNQDAVIDAVHETLKQSIPDMTRSEAIDALSGYGQFSAPSKSEIDIAIRELNALHLQASKQSVLNEAIAKAEELREEGLSDDEIAKQLIADGLQLKATGYVRGEQTDLVRHMIAQTNELKKELPVLPAAREGQLQTALDAAKKATRNRINDLQWEIDNKERIVKVRKTTKADADLKALRKERDELIAVHRKIFPARARTEAQRIAAAESALDKAIARIEQEIKTGDIGVRKVETVSTPAIDAKRATLDALRAEKQALRDIANPKMTPEQRAMINYEANILRRIADYQARVAEKDFAPRKKKVRELSDAELKLKKRLEDTKVEFLKKAGEYELANLSPAGKALYYVKQTAHLSRALMTSIDLSAVFRQGGIAAYSHPKLAKKAAGEMFKAIASKQNEFNTAEKMRQHPLWQISQTAKLSITNDDKITKQEEAFMGKWAEKVPGVAASGRAYTTFLNSMRFNLFVNMVESIGKNGKVTVDEARVIAKYINAATGRADFKALNGAAANLNTVFFAPRYVASRFQYLALPFALPFMNTTPRVKKMIAAEYARTFGGAALFISSLIALGALTADGEDEEPTFELDPRSTDFMKIKIQDTRIDPLAGLSQVIVFSSKVLSGSTKSPISGKVRSLDDVKGPYAQNRATVALRFARTKLGPIPGATVTAMNDMRDVIGKKHTATSLTSGLFIPLSLREVKDTIEARGATKGTAISMMALFGMGVGSYGKRTEYLAADKSEKERIFTKDLKRARQGDGPLGYQDRLTREQVARYNRALRRKRKEKKDDKKDSNPPWRR